MFLHGGWMHLGNMLYLWIFGDNVEDGLGHVTYVVFYLLCGWMATLAHAYLNTGSTIPSIGASGAIAGVLGAYLVLFPHARVVTLVPMGFYMRMRDLPAVLVLGLWFVIQFFSGVVGLGSADGTNRGRRLVGSHRWVRGRDGAGILFRGRLRRQRDLRSYGPGTGR